MKNNNPINSDVQIEKHPEQWKVVTTAISKSKGYIIKTQYEEESTIFIIRVFPEEPKEKKEKMKDLEFKELKDLILRQGNETRSNYQELQQELKSNYQELKQELKSNYQELNKKLDDHIDEFHSFKLDMLAFKSDMLSLPTIAKELQNK